MSDWTVDAADAVEKYVAMLRDRTVEPALAITRIAVFGLLAVLIAAALFLAAIGVFRLVVIIEQGYVWAAWFTFSGIFLIVGGLLWTMRNP
jgi:hypothetical protein